MLISGVQYKLNEASNGLRIDVCSRIYASDSRNEFAHHYQFGEESTLILGA